jgi:hypothetical protein
MGAAVANEGKVRGVGDVAGAWHIVLGLDGVAQRQV